MMIRLAERLRLKNPSPENGRHPPRQIVVIGAGVGGLTAAAVLARAGLDVTVLEAHVYPGGCAGTFYYQGYRFDAGATLAGGFSPGGPMERIALAAGIDHWPARPTRLAMRVHMPEGSVMDRWGDERRHAERLKTFGPGAQRFWNWQESTADAMWELAMRLPPWPPQSAGQIARLGREGLAWAARDLGAVSPLGLLADAARPVAAHLGDVSDRLRQFVDAQLLISAQTTSSKANALYGAAALDLPRRGVVELESGMGTIAQVLAGSLAQHGGRLHYRKQATRILLSAGRPQGVETRTGEVYPADLVIVNLPPWNVARLLGDAAGGRLKSLPSQPRDGWGAFTVYVGLDGSVVPADFPLHHQVITAEPLAEGNTVFFSLSPSWDLDRAPLAHRALTLSTHTALAPWWELYEHDRQAFEARKQLYTHRLLAAAERALPGLQEAAELILPGTPLAFARFTRREWGWVGGFPQTHLWRSWGPRLGNGLWMVGDSIFPGQSTPAVALGGLRVAHQIMKEHRVAADVPNGSYSGVMQAPSYPGRNGRPREAGGITAREPGAVLLPPGQKAGAGSPPPDGRALQAPGQIDSPR